jgi:hypothetical protein
MNFLVPLIVSAAASGLKAAAKGAKADDVGSPPPPAQPITSSVDPFRKPWSNNAEAQAGRRNHPDPQGEE